MERAIAEIVKMRDSTQKEIEHLLREIGDFKARIEHRESEINKLCELKVEYDQIIETLKGVTV